jgi:hypothetical protein
LVAVITFVWTSIESVMFETINLRFNRTMLILGSNEFRCSLSFKFLFPAPAFLWHHNQAYFAFQFFSFPFIANPNIS